MSANSKRPSHGVARAVIDPSSNLFIRVGLHRIPPVAASSPVMWSVIENNDLRASEASGAPLKSGDLNLDAILSRTHPFWEGGIKSFFKGARGAQTGDFQFIEANNVTVHTGGGADDTPIGTSIPPRA